MTNYWEHHPSSFLGADQPVHAGITKQLCYNNIMSVYENCGYDYTAAFGKVFPLTTSWAWIDFLSPPVPVYGSSTGYHNIDVEIQLETTIAGDIRCYGLPLAPFVSVDASLNDFESDLYVEQEFTASNQEITFTMSFDQVLKRPTKRRRFAFIYFVFAVKGDSAVSFQEIRAIRYQEIIP